MRNHLTLVTLVALLLGASGSLYAQAKGHWEFNSSSIFGNGHSGVSQEGISVTEMRSYDKGVFTLTRSYTAPAGNAQKEYEARYTVEIGGVYREIRPGAKLEVKASLKANQGGGPLDYTLWGRAMVVFKNPEYSPQNYSTKRVRKDGTWEGSLTDETGQSLRSVHGNESASVTFAGKVQEPPKGSSHMYVVITFAEMGLVFQYDWISEDADIYLKSVTFPKSGTYEAELVYYDNDEDWHLWNAKTREDYYIEDAPMCFGTCQLNISQSGVADIDADVRFKITKGDLAPISSRHTYRIRGLKKQYRFGDTMEFTVEGTGVVNEGSRGVGIGGAEYDMMDRLQRAFDPDCEHSTEEWSSDLGYTWLESRSCHRDGGSYKHRIWYEVLDSKNYSEDIVLRLPLYADGGVEIRYGWTAAGSDGTTMGASGDAGSSGLGDAATWVGVGGGLLIGVGVARARLKKRASGKGKPGKLKRKKGEDYDEWLKRQAQHVQKAKGMLFPVEPKEGEYYSEWLTRQNKAEKEGRKSIRDKARKYNVSDTDPTTGEKKDLERLREETKKAIRRETNRENRKDENWIQQQAAEEERAWAESEAWAELTDTVAEGTVNVIGDTVPGGRAVKNAHTFLKAVGKRASESYNSGGSVLTGMAKGAVEGGIGVGQNQLDKVQWGKLGGEKTARVAKNLANGGMESLKTFVGELNNGKSVSEACQTAAAKGASATVVSATGDLLGDAAQKGFSKFAGKQWKAYDKIAEAARKTPTFENTMKQLDQLQKTAQNLRVGKEASEWTVNTAKEVLTREVTDPYFKGVTEALNSGKNVDAISQMQHQMMGKGPGGPVVDS